MRWGHSGWVPFRSGTWGGSRGRSPLDRTDRVSTAKLKSPLVAR
jgi:hypothetical protein